MLAKVKETGTYRLKVGPGFKMLFLEDSGIMDVSVVDLPIPQRAQNALRHQGIYNVRQFVHWYEDQRLRHRDPKLRNVGKDTLAGLWGGLLEAQMDYAPDPVAYCQRLLELNYPRKVRYNLHEE